MQIYLLWFIVICDRPTLYQEPSGFLPSRPMASSGLLPNYPYKNSLMLCVIRILSRFPTAAPMIKFKKNQEYLIRNLLSEEKAVDYNHERYEKLKK